MNRLREERKKIHKTQSDIAKRLNITQQAYSVYENESIQPTKNMMIAIARAFGQKVSYLFCLEEELEMNEEKPLEIEEDNLTEAQKILIEKVKSLDDVQCKQISYYTDKIVALDKQEEEKVKKLFQEKYSNKYNTSDD